MIDDELLRLGCRTGTAGFQVTELVLGGLDCGIESANGSLYGVRSASTVDGTGCRTSLASAAMEWLV